MKKGIFVTTALLIFLAVPTTSKTEMRITPDGVTFPDDSTQTTAVSGGGISAPLHLNGSFSSSSLGPDEAVISGVNVYTGSDLSCGVHGYAGSNIGSGVYGEAAGPNGKGVLGRATGNSGSGVHGYSNGSSGKGVYGYADGDNGRGVYGYASSSVGHGVYGHVTGTHAEGVYGYATGTYGEGVYGYATGSAGKGVYGWATGSGGRGVHGYATGSTGRGVYGWGQQYNFYAGGPGTDYGAFTGGHEVKFSQDMPEEIMAGLIVSVTGKSEIRRDGQGAVSLSSTLPTVTLSGTTADKAVFGALVSQCPLPKDHWYEAREDERFGVVNALGEGRVWVTNRSGKIEAGDYITTSEIPGYGQLQDDDLLHSYTLGKAIETIDWEQVRETVQYCGKSYKRYLIAVVYTSG